MCLNCVQSPIKFRWSKSHFAIMVLIIFAVISFKQIGLQFLGTSESPFPLYKRDRILVCHDSKSHLLSCNY